MSRTVAFAVQRDQNENLSTTSNGRNKRYITKSLQKRRLFVAEWARTSKFLQNRRLLEAD